MSDYRRECNAAIEEMLATDRAIRYTFSGHLTRTEGNRGLARSHERCDRRIAEAARRHPVLRPAQRAQKG